MPSKAQPRKNPSALKRVRQAEKRSLRNKTVRSEVKTAVKRLRTAVELKDKAEVTASLRSAVKIISSAAVKGIIHRNTAARNISRLSRLANIVLKAEAV